MTIDVHAHYLPDGYRAALLANGHGQPDGMPRIPDWSAEEHVAVMDRLGIATSLLSISSPGVHLGDGAATVDLAREVNEVGRRAVVDHPGRFGLLAALPLPDVDAAMAEIAHCCDHLDVPGFAVLTNVGGTYVGDPEFQPVLRELDRRGARLFIHPTSPPCWEHSSFGRPRAMLEFLFDTTRAVVDLVLGGVVAGHPGIEFLIPHAGATLAMVADRVGVFSLLLGVDPSVDVLRDLGRLHFDLAGFPLPRSTLCSLSRRPTTCTTAATTPSPPSPPPRPLVTGWRRSRIRRGCSTSSTPTPSGCSPRWPTGPDPRTHPKETTMQHRLELGYLVLEVPAPDGLAPALADVVGLVAGEPAASGVATWRNDRRAHRLIVQPGDANDAVAVGVEAVDIDAFEGAVARLRASGHDVSDDAELAVDRGVGRLARTTAPWGTAVEVVLDQADAPTPFSSELVPGGFLTDGVGFGHVVLATTAFDESVSFVTEGLGFAQSDWLETELAPGIVLEVRFFHCNARHHTVALARAPFDLPQVLHHVMFEMNDRDDVGAAFDRLWATDLGIPNGLGRHDNDGMFSFYLQTPAGFQVEVGHGARVITEGWDDNRAYAAISAWGHQPMRPACSAPLPTAWGRRRSSPAYASG